MIEWLKKHPVELSSMFIALLALFTTVYQAELTRKHNRLSVIPLMLFSSSEIEYEISLTNNGAGPGIVLGLEMMVKDEYFIDNDAKKIRSIIAETIKRSSLQLSGEDYIVTAYDGFMVLKPGDKVKLLELINDKKSKEFVELMKLINFGVCYKSIYNDRFFIKTSDFIIPNNSCNYHDSVEIFGNFYRFYGILNQPLSPSEILGN